MESVSFEEMRRSMVDSQLRTSGVTDAWVLTAMGKPGTFGSPEHVAALDCRVRREADAFAVPRIGG